MKSPTIAGCCGVILASLLSLNATAAEDADSSLGTNTNYGQAQRASGEPSYGKTADQPAPAPQAAASETVAPEAAAPVATAPVVKAAPCVPTVLSHGAVGLPCQTTVEFIKSLGLSPKRQAKAIAGVAKADKALAH